MKKIDVNTWLITLLMIMMATPVCADDWNSEDVSMEVGETITLYLPSSITSLKLKSVNFYSASYNYVEVVSHSNYSVKVKALKASSTPVIVRCDYYYYINNGGYIYQNGGAYDFMITVGGDGKSNINPTSISIPATIELEVGETQDIEPILTPSNAECNLTWSISDESVATIYSNGMITGKSEGHARITVTAANGVYATAQLYVNPISPRSIKIDESLKMQVGSCYTIYPDVFPSNSKYTLSWYSSEPDVVSVSKSGELTALKTGNAVVIASTNNGLRASCWVLVYDQKLITNISINPSLSMKVGDTDTLNVSITPSDAKTSLSWSSDDNGVAEVSQDGVIKAISEGIANIMVESDNGIKATCIVTVSAKDYTLGDLDNNGEYDINDALCIVNYILNQPVETFVEEVADLDKNGKITINDAVLYISNYFHDTTTSDSLQVTCTDKGDSEENYVNIEDFEIQPGEEKIIHVLMENKSEEIMGIQCDITLPTGLSFLPFSYDEEYITASSRMPNDMALYSGMLSEKTLRVVGICTGWSSITGNAGSVFSFKLKAGENITAGRYQIQLSNIELSNGRMIVNNDHISSLEVSNIASGIERKTVDIQNSIIYDLKGQRVETSKAKKGIYIVNGKKVLVK